jgi:hypothetical protein
MEAAATISLLGGPNAAALLSATTSAPRVAQSLLPCSAGAAFHAVANGACAVRPMVMVSARPAATIGASLGLQPRVASRLGDHQPEPKRRMLEAPPSAALAPGSDARH